MLNSRTTSYITLILFIFSQHLIGQNIAHEEKVEISSGIGSGKQFIEKGNDGYFYVVSQDGDRPYNYLFVYRFNDQGIIKSEFTRNFEFAVRPLRVEQNNNNKLEITCGVNPDVKRNDEDLLLYNVKLDFNNTPVIPEEKSIHDITSDNSEDYGRDLHKANFDKNNNFIISYNVTKYTLLRKYNSKIELEWEINVDSVKPNKNRIVQSRLVSLQEIENGYSLLNLHYSDNDDYDTLRYTTISSNGDVISNGKIDYNLIGKDVRHYIINDNENILVIRDKKNNYIFATFDNEFKLLEEIIINENELNFTSEYTSFKNEPLKLSDGGYIFYGLTSSNPEEANGNWFETKQKMRITRLDSKFNVVWDKLWNESAKGAISEINDAVELDNGNIAVTGRNHDTLYVAVINDPILNVDSYYDNNELSIHPNPTDGKVNIDLEGIKSVSVYNLQMQEVKAINNVGSTTIDLTEQPTGVYFLEVEDISGNVYFEKIIKR